MTNGSDLLERVRAAQVALGTGTADGALALVEPLLDETRDALRAPDFIARSPDDRRAVVDAYCYARVTAVLAVESSGAAVAAPRVRALAADAADVAAIGNDGWKVLCAAAEILARCGDGAGAAWAVRAAGRTAPEEPYVEQLRATVESMFPQAFRDGGLSR